MQTVTLSTSGYFSFVSFEIGGSFICEQETLTTSGHFSFLSFYMSFFMH